MKNRVGNRLLFMDIAHNHDGRADIFPALVEFSLRADNKTLVGCGHAYAVEVAGGVEVCCRCMAFALVLLEGEVCPLLEVEAARLLERMTVAGVNVAGIDCELFALVALKKRDLHCNKLFLVGFVDIDAYSAAAFVVRVHESINVLDDALEGWTASGKNPSGIVYLFRAIEGYLDGLYIEIVETGNFFGVEQIAVGNHAEFIDIEIKGHDFGGNVAYNVKRKKGFSAIPGDGEMLYILVPFDEMYKPINGFGRHHG